MVVGCLILGLRIASATPVPFFDEIPKESVPIEATSTSPIPFTSPSTQNGTMKNDVGWLKLVYDLTVLYPERKIAEDSLR